MTAPLPSLRDLLSKHGLLDANRTPLVHTGFSGAELTRVVRPDGASFILKRMSIDRDWIMRATDDGACREAAFARAAPEVGPLVQTPSLGAAVDGDSHVLVMRDITPDLLPPGPISDDHLARIIAAMASLHGASPPHAVPWCDLSRRLTLLTPAGAAVARLYGAPVADDIVEGWRLFDKHASPAAAELIHALFADPAPLLRALDRLPTALLHGDLKLDNIGLDPDGRAWLIDWAMTLVAPPAVELGWFLAINSRRLPCSLDTTLRAYADAALVSPSDRPRHDALTVVCGLLLRGWRKALDAEAGNPAELRWWCERAEAARSFIDAPR